MPLKYQLELILLSALWGASFLFMRVASPEFGPVGLVAMRTLLAAMLLMPFVIHRKLFRDVARHWRGIFVVALLNTALPFVLFAYSTLHLQAGYTSILNASAPMFAALLGWLWLNERLSATAVSGLLISFFGVTVLTLQRAGMGGDYPLWPVLAALFATFCYGLAACYTRRYLHSVSPLALAGGSQLFAVIIVLPFALFSLPAEMPSGLAWVNVVMLGIFCTGVAYLLYFDLIANVGPAKAISVTYLIPVFGVLWGMLLLDEKLTLHMLIGAALILFGVSLTTGVIARRKQPSD